jgi:hypothetical protein
MPFNLIPRFQLIQWVFLESGSDNRLTTICSSRGQTKNGQMFCLWETQWEMCRLAIRRNMISHANNLYLEPAFQFCMATWKYLFRFVCSSDLRRFDPYKSYLFISIACYAMHLRILYVSDDRKCLFQQMQKFQVTLLCYYLLMLFSTHKTQPVLDMHAPYFEGMFSGPSHHSVQ